MVACLGDWLAGEGLRVAVLSRGYGRRSRAPLLVSDDRSTPVDWRVAGDEPFWLANRLPSALVAVAKKRADGLRLLEDHHPDVVLLDDAFQHRAVARDIDLVLVDAAEDLLRQRVLPFGKLREPLAALGRATVVVLTHAESAHPDTEKWIAQNIRVPVFHADYAPRRSDLAGRKLAAFCALGSPHHFFAMLQCAGATLVSQHEFRDHHVYTESEIVALQSEAERSGAEALVTTAKDAVKVPPVPEKLPLEVIEADLVVREQQAWVEFLRSRIPPPGNDPLPAVPGS
jgi:tetraacyldisaccharide 4'-kinase